MFQLAATCAQGRLTPGQLNPEWLHCGSLADRNRAAYAFSLVRVPPNGGLASIRLRALRLIWDDEFWACIERVADVLESRWRLSGDEVQEVCGGGVNDGDEEGNGR